MIRAGDRFCNVLPKKRTLLASTTLCCLKVGPNVHCISLPSWHACQQTIAESCKNHIKSQPHGVGPKGGLGLRMPSKNAVAFAIISPVTSLKVWRWRISIAKTNFSMLACLALWRGDPTSEAGVDLFKPTRIQARRPVSRPPRTAMTPRGSQDLCSTATRLAAPTSWTPDEDDSRFCRHGRMLGSLPPHWRPTRVTSPLPSPLPRLRRHWRLQIP